MRKRQRDAFDVANLKGLAYKAPDRRSVENPFVYHFVGGVDSRCPTAEVRRSRRRLGIWPSIEEEIYIPTIGIS